jgi:tetratricopeptide (TPR) repeat protein
MYADFSLHQRQHIVNIISFTYLILKKEIFVLPMKDFALLISSLFLLIKAGYGQSLPEAFLKYQSGDYQSAIKLYREQMPFSSSLHNVYMLGLCYEKADSLIQAKHQYETIIESPIKYYESIKVESCSRLANMYIKEKNYGKALEYYKLYAAMFQQARFNDINWKRQHFVNASNQGRCYAALGLIDSAIKVMTPHMYVSHEAINRMLFGFKGENSIKDSVMHDSICRSYVRLLQKKYSNKRLKAELQNAEKHFVFKETREYKQDSKFLWEQVKCTTNIFNTPVTVAEFGVGNNTDILLPELQEPPYTKQYQLDQFKSLLVCRLIRDLPKQNQISF